MIEIGRTYHIKLAHDLYHISLYKKFNDNLACDSFQKSTFCLVLNKKNDRNHQMIQAIFHFGIFCFIENDAILIPM